MAGIGDDVSFRNDVFRQGIDDADSALVNIECTGYDWVASMTSATVP